MDSISGTVRAPVPLIQPPCCQCSLQESSAMDLWGLRARRPGRPHHWLSGSRPPTPPLEVILIGTCSFPPVRQGPARQAAMASPARGPSAASPRSVADHYDDFGNVVDATPNGAATGAVRFEYDAGGRQLKKRTPSMATGEYLRWVYDGSGRMFELDDVLTSTTVLYKLAWDAGGVAAPTGG